MVMSSFDQMPAVGVVHKACPHLIDAAHRSRSQRDAPRVSPHWCTTHGGAAGLMCAEDAAAHEAEQHHGDASFTRLAPMPAGVEFVDDDGRRLVLGPDIATVALLVFYAD